MFESRTENKMLAKEAQQAATCNGLEQWRWQYDLVRLQLQRIPYRWRNDGDRKTVMAMELAKTVVVVVVREMCKAETTACHNNSKLTILNQW